MLPTPFLHEVIDTQCEDKGYVINQVEDKIPPPKRGRVRSAQFHRFSELGITLLSCLVVTVYFIIPYHTAVGLLNSHLLSNYINSYQFY